MCLGHPMLDETAQRLLLKLVLPLLELQTAILTKMTKLMQNKINDKEFANFRFMLNISMYNNLEFSRPAQHKELL